MKKYHLGELASVHHGEYVLGSDALRTHACYCVYGVLKPRESGRVISPGKGHEEIVCLIEGSAKLTNGDTEFALGKEEAFHLRGDERYVMENTGDGEARYIIAGGHSEDHGH